MLVETVVIASLVLYSLCFWIFGYWDRRNVFNVKWKFTFDSFVKVVIGKKHFQYLLDDLYMNYKRKGLIGFYTLFTPMLLVTDPELVKTVFVKDFNKFSDSGMEVSEKNDPFFAKNPFLVKGMGKWKELRGIQASVQTTAKFKEMVPILFKVGENLVNYLIRKKMEPVCVKEMTFLYTVDNTCTCAFGIEPTALTDPENDFVKYANSKKLFSSSPCNVLFSFFLPCITSFLRLRFLSEDAEEFFKTFVQRIVEHRSRTNISKNDLIDYIMKLNQKRSEENKPAYTNLEMAAHCLTFYLDSTETTSNQLAFFLLDLANHPEVQEKIRKEIYSIGKSPTDFDLDKIHSINYLNMAFNVLKQHQTNSPDFFFDLANHPKVQENIRKEICSIGKSPTDFDLEKIHSLNYLNMALNESLRLNSQLRWLSRTCTQDTVLDNVRISKGTKLFVPVSSFHSDPEFFNDPGKYDPERFSEENKNAIGKYAFLPFGEGPRICVGFKFALLQIKLAVIFLLLNFTILPSTDDSKENIGSSDSVFLVPGPETKLRFKPLTQLS